MFPKHHRSPAFATVPVGDVFTGEVGVYRDVQFLSNDDLIPPGDHRYWMVQGRRLAKRDYAPLERSEGWTKGPTS